MLITITGCEQGPTWETAQALVRQCRNDEKLVLTAISRTDHLPDYRGIGTYLLTAKQGDGLKINIDLKVEG